MFAEYVTFCLNRLHYFSFIGPSNMMNPHGIPQAPWNLKKNTQNEHLNGVGELGREHEVILARANFQAISMPYDLRC